MRSALAIRSFSTPPLFGFGFGFGRPTGPRTLHSPPHRRNISLNTWPTISAVNMEWTSREREANLHVDEVAGHKTELLELHSPNPSLQVILIPGNPGIIGFYKEYVEALYHHFNGRASITAICHVSHTSKDWEKGKLFSLEEQITHKVDLVERKLSITEVPLVLVGHSIGAYISLCILKKFPHKVHHVVGLYPFLTLNKASRHQALIRWFARIALLRELLSSFAGFLGLLPKKMSKFLVKHLIGRNWSRFAIDVACGSLLHRSVVNNFCYMGMTEFIKLREEPNWNFMKEKQDQISLLFGLDDHWGPLAHYEKVGLEAPNLDVTLEEEGHDHAFCCTTIGSDWVAKYTANVILSNMSKTRSNLG